MNFPTSMLTTVEIATLKEVTWTEAPERHEAGSPNVIGAVALASALKFLGEVGMDAIAAHEAELTRYALGRLSKIEGVTIFGSTDVERADQRVGVIPFQLEGIPHSKAAAIFPGSSGPLSALSNELTPLAFSIANAFA